MFALAIIAGFFNFIAIAFAMRDGVAVCLSRDVERFPPVMLFRLGMSKFCSFTIVLFCMMELKLPAIPFVLGAVVGLALFCYEICNHNRRSVATSGIT